MLSVLHIENIAVIEQAEVRFDRGFNALTGETGAGKSIVIDAISAILGERTYRDCLRTGAKSAFVSAIFTLSLIHILPKRSPTTAASRTSCLPRWKRAACRRAAARGISAAAL